MCELVLYTRTRPMCDESTRKLLLKSLLVGLHAQPSTMLQFESILRSYLSHNYTTTYANVYPVWKVR